MDQPGLLETEGARPEPETIILRVHIDCPECCEGFDFDFDYWKKRVLKTIRATRPPNYGSLMRVLERYKQIKGYDRISTWDGRYKGRALKAISKLLWFFRRLPDPTVIALECLEEMSKEFTQKGLTWHIETIAERADDWLARKQK